MTVVFDRPYEFVPPHRGNLWPSFIQTFRIVDRYLKRKEGVVSYECRGLDHLRESLGRGDGILLAPNHCRYADPLVLGWPAREVGTHVYAMASWHLFNKGKFDSFAIRKMGGFSINREGTDRPSLETAIEILAQAERPLILFPEGTTNRTNDVLKPMLEGVSFIARSAARRRKKADSGQVVMHPIAIKYLCVSGFPGWADRQLTRLEQHLGWQKQLGRSFLQRTIRLAEGLLTLQEIQYLGKAQGGSLSDRRDQLIAHLLQVTEDRLGNRGARKKRCVTESDRFAPRLPVNTSPRRLTKTNRFVCGATWVAADLAQELSSYPDCYLQGEQVTDTRVIETIQRIAGDLVRQSRCFDPVSRRDAVRAGNRSAGQPGAAG